MTVTKYNSISHSTDLPSLETCPEVTVPIEEDNAIEQDIRIIIVEDAVFYNGRWSRMWWSRHPLAPYYATRIIFFLVIFPIILYCLFYLLN